MTLGKNNCREGLNVCMNYVFKMLHHVDVVAKRLHATAETAVHEGDDNTHLGPTGRGVKTSASCYIRTKKIKTSINHFHF